jgi:exopolysaccharide production protein ExoY
MSTTEVLLREAAPLSAASIAGKRLIDILLSAAALIALSPVMLVIAVLVFASSPGRVTFTQQRVGLNGALFPIIKFRTMVRHAERLLETDPELHRIYLANNHKIPAELDTRITKVGRFLRNTSLDELPQFLNVLLGHMSLVGPRPVVPGELFRYGQFEDLYLSVKPGLTGAWQVGGRSTIGYEERVLLDVGYITNRSTWLDLKIILKTVPAVLRRHGAH